MDLILLILSFVIIIIGIIGSVTPIIPGPLTSWLGLFVLSKISNVEISYILLIITFIISISIFTLDYIIPIYTSKKFGATKFGIIGATIGLIIGLFLSPFGIILGSIIGAFFGEIIYNNNIEKSMKASIGLFLGFIISSFSKAIISISYLIIYIILILNNLENLF